MEYEVFHHYIFHLSLQNPLKSFPSKGSKESKDEKLKNQFKIRINKYKFLIWKDFEVYG